MLTFDFFVRADTTELMAFISNRVESTITDERYTSSITYHIGVSFLFLMTLHFRNTIFNSDAFLVYI